MKKITVFVLFAILFNCGCKNKTDIEFPILKGDYLGQALPGEKAEIFAPDIISAGMYERDIAISPDGNEICYSLFQGDWNTIMVTRRIDGIWNEPVVAEFARDTSRFFAEPAFSSDGDKIYYLSTKQGWTEQDIWVAEKKENGTWGEGEKLPENINQLGEFYPSFNKSGTMYFCRTDETSGISQILRSKFEAGIFHNPEVLPPPINGKGTNFNACIAPDDSYLIGCVAGRDSLNPRRATYMLFFHNPDDTWSEGIDLIKELELPCNNAISVSVTSDGKYLFFSSTQKTIRFKDLEPNWAKSSIQDRRTSFGNGNSDIYWMRFDGIVERLKEKYL